MRFQSLSIVVPAKKCVNDCKFCVSKMHESEYETMISDKNLYYDLYKKDFINRLAFSRDNGCNTVMLTGDCEPLQNRSFLTKFGDFNQTLASPFRTIEIQTVGNLLTREYLYFLRHHVGVTTISLSVSDVWDDFNNAKIIGCEPFNLNELCEAIKQYRFNLRLSLNMTTEQGTETHKIKDFFDRAKELGADQLTFRKMYGSGLYSQPEVKWVADRAVPEKWWQLLSEAIHVYANEIDRLEYGLTKYDMDGIGVVVDTDCMSEKSEDVAKYLILRPDCKLYSKWETKASLIF